LLLWFTSLEQFADADEIVEIETDSFRVVGFLRE
jgi:hypothetical protein